MIFGAKDYSPSFTVIRIDEDVEFFENRSIEDIIYGLWGKYARIYIAYAAKGAMLSRDSGGRLYIDAEDDEYPELYPIDNSEVTPLIDALSSLDYFGYAVYGPFSIKKMVKYWDNISLEHKPFYIILPEPYTFI